MNNNKYCQYTEISLWRIERGLRAKYPFTLDKRHDVMEALKAAYCLTDIYIKELHVDRTAKNIKMLDLADRCLRRLYRKVYALAIND